MSGHQVLRDLEEKVTDTPTATAQAELQEAQEAEIPKYVLPYTLQLQYPVRLGKQEITELKFKHPVRAYMVSHLPAGDMKKDLRMGHFLPIIANMTGEIPQLIDELDWGDMQKAMEVVNYFLLRGRVITKS